MTAPVTVPTTDTVRAHAERLMAALGDNPTTIAASLHAAGIRGERCNEGTCPIAEFLLRSDLGLLSVAVSGNIAILWFGYGSNDTALVDVPDACEDFIERFDQGGFDELLKDRAVSSR